MKRWAVGIPFALPFAILLFQNCSAGKFGNLDSFQVLSSVSQDCSSSPSSEACVNSSSISARPTCSFNGQTLPEGQSVQAYQNSNVNVGQTCTMQTRSCSNGTLTGTYAFATCAVGKPAACLFNGQTIAHNQSVGAYLTSSVLAGQSCISQTRTCNNGNLSGSFLYGACTVGSPASCLFNGQTIAHGQSVKAYQNSTAPVGQSCVSQTRTCNNGNLDGSFVFGACGTEQAAACMLSGQTIADGQSILAYANPTVPFDKTCQPQTRICNNGSLSNSGDYLSCTVTPGMSCVINGQILPSDSAVTLYFQSVASSASTGCTKEQRVCKNGVLSGSATFNSCIVSINMSEVLSAFAAGFSGQAKKRSFREQLGPDSTSWIHNEYVTERFLLSAMGQWEYPKHDHLAVSQIGDTKRPGVIHDLWAITSNQVGIMGTYQKADNIYLCFSPLLAIGPQNLTGGDLNRSSTTTFSVLSGLEKVLTESSKTIPKSLETTTVDTKGQIGSRWALVVKLRDNNPDMPDEYWYYDLGPQEGVYQPKYGAIGYRHANVLQNSSLGTWEFYGDIVDMTNFHETDLGNFLSF